MKIMIFMGGNKNEEDYFIRKFINETSDIWMIQFDGERYVAAGGNVEIRRSPTSPYSLKDLDFTITKCGNWKSKGHEYLDAIEVIERKKREDNYTKSQKRERMARAALARRY